MLQIKQNQKIPIIWEKQQSPTGEWTAICLLNGTNQKIHFSFACRTLFLFRIQSHAKKTRLLIIFRFADCARFPAAFNEYKYSFPLPPPSYALETDGIQ